MKFGIFEHRYIYIYIYIYTKNTKFHHIDHIDHIDETQLHAKTCLDQQIKRRILSAQLAEQERVSVPLKSMCINILYELPHGSTS